MTVKLSVPKEDKEKVLTAVFDADCRAHWKGDSEITSDIVAAVYDDKSETLTLTSSEDPIDNTPDHHITDPAFFCGLSEYKEAK